VIAHDRATGREVWRRTDMTDFWSPAAGRLLLSRDDDQAPMILADATTGRTIGDPIVGQMHTFGSSTAARTMFLLRATTAPAGRTAVTRLDLTDGRQTLLGTVAPLTEEGCREQDAYLACVRDNQLTVTGAA
jgi:hypothetical protein